MRRAQNPSRCARLLERSTMHELSIVTYVVKQVQEIAKENNLTEIESVTLEFG